MMIGVPSVEIPQWPLAVASSHRHPHPHPHQDNSSATTKFSSFAAALQHYLPCNNDTNEVCLEDYFSDGEYHDMVDDDVPLLDAFTCDEFRMYEFKVRRCARGRSHDWTECPYAHPGEKARRRDPRKFHYSGSACPEFRKGSCRRGDSCEFAHGVFECWLHPSRYRTQPCKDGVGCRRRVCFFAHTPDQLRVLPPVEGYDGSPMRKGRGGGGAVVLSPTSCLVGPVSPNGSSCSGGFGSPPVSPTVEEVVMEMRKLQLRKKAKAVGMGLGWDLRQPQPQPQPQQQQQQQQQQPQQQQQQQQMGFERARGFEGWYSEPAPEKVSLVESSVDEPAWFSDIVN